MSNTTAVITAIDRAIDAFDRSFPEYEPGSGGRGVAGHRKYTPTTLAGRNKVRGDLQKMKARVMNLDVATDTVKKPKKGGGSRKKKRF